MGIDEITIPEPPPPPLPLQYSLSRGQRLVPHLSAWGPACVLAPGALVAAVALAVHLSWWSLPFVGLVVLLRGFFVGLLDVLLNPVRPMDLILENHAVGVLVNGRRWWFFLDSVSRIGRYRPDVLTIEHPDGWVVNIPAALLTAHQIAYLRWAVKRGRDPDVVKRVIERGRRLQVLDRMERGAGPD